MYFFPFTGGSKIRFSSKVNAEAFILIFAEQEEIANKKEKVVALYDKRGNQINK